MDAVWTPDTMDERTEGELRGVSRQMATAMGVENFRNAVMNFALANEEFLRRTTRPDHPTILALDAYHRKQELGFE